MPVIYATELKFIYPIANKSMYMAYMPAVLIAAGIAVLSLTEANHMPSVQVNDKLAHGLMYTLLSIAMIVPASRFSRARVRPYLYVWVAATLYGGLIEVLQGLCTLTRTCSITDIYANLIGVTIGVLLIAVWRITSTR